MATYKEIEIAFRNEFGSTIKTCWIADVKRRLGHNVRIASNRKLQGKIKNPCPHEKIQLISEIINRLQ